MCFKAVAIQRNSNNFMSGRSDKFLSYKNHKKNLELNHVNENIKKFRYLDKEGQEDI